MRHRISLNDFFCGIVIVLTIVLSALLSNEYSVISEYVPKLDSLMRFALPIYLAMLPVIIAAATFLYQIYYNRYSLKEYKYALRMEFIWLFVLLGLELALLSLFWGLKESNSFLFFESILVLFVLLVRFFIFLKRFNEYSVGGFVQNYTDKCIKTLEIENFNKKKFLRIMSDINRYFRESVERKETCYAEMIIRSKNKIFRSYICQVNGLILKNKLEENDNEELVDSFVDSVHGDYRVLCENACTMRIIGLYSYEIADVLKTAIKCKNTMIFDKMIEEIQRCFGLVDIEDVGFLNEIFEIVHEYACEKEKKEFAQKIETRFLKAFRLIGYKKNCSKMKRRLMISCERFMSLNVEKNIETEQFVNDFVIRIEEEMKTFDRSETECVFGVMFKIYELVEKKRNKKLFNLLLLKVYDLTKNCIMIKNDLAVQLFSVLLSKLIESDLVEEENVDKKMLNCFLLCIDYCPKEALLYFPDYLEKLKKEQTERVCNVIKDAFDEIVQRLSVSRDDRILFECFDSLNKCIELFSAQERKCQEVLISIYKKGLLKNIKGEDCGSFDVVMNRFNAMLEMLNAQNKISRNLLDVILEIFDSVGEKIMETTNYSMQDDFVDYVRKLGDVFPVINKEKNIKNRIPEMIFHYIVSVLQYKNEKSLKICSNALGWCAIDMEKIGDIARYEEVVSYAVHMYELAYEQDFDKSTQAFLGTLFVILGAYATAKKEKMYIGKLKEKIEQMKNRSILILSKRLRYYEARCWDPFLENDAKGCINTFFNSLKLD